MRKLTNNIKIAANSLCTAAIMAAKSSNITLLKTLLDLYTKLNTVNSQLMINQKRQQENSKRVYRKHRLVVKFYDGAVFDSINATKTFVDAILYIGIDRIKAAGITYSSYQLVSDSQQTTKNYHFKRINNKYLIVPPSIDEKLKVLQRIANALSVPLTANSIDVNDTQYVPTKYDVSYNISKEITHA